MGVRGGGGKSKSECWLVGVGYGVCLLPAGHEPNEQGTYCAEEEEEEEEHANKRTCTQMHAHTHTHAYMLRMLVKCFCGVP